MSGNTKISDENPVTTTLTSRSSSADDNYVSDNDNYSYGSNFDNTSDVEEENSYTGEKINQTEDGFILEPDIELQKTNYSLLYVDPEQRPPIFKSTFQEYICIFLCIFGPAAASMASCAYQTLLTETSNYFNVVGGQLTWSVSSVMLANGACLLLMGGIADAFGRKNAMIIGFTMYAVFALIGGFMHNYVVLCIFRGLQGAAVACSTPAAAGFLGSTYKDSKRKNMVMSCFGIGAPVGGASGYFIAGICSVALDWRAAQFFLAILFGALAISVFIFIPNDSQKINWKHCRDVFKNLDYGGALLSLSSFTLICFSLTNVDQATNRWRTPYIIALLVVGIFLIPVFVLYEIYIPKSPLMPMQLFKNRNFCLCMAIAGLSWINFYGMLNYNAIMYFEDIRKYHIMIVACCFLTQPISGTLVNIFAGLTMHKIPGKILIFIGTLGFTGAAIVWATMSEERNYFKGPFWAFILSVIGADLIYNVSNRVTLSSLEKKLQSRGAGTFNTITQLSSSVGLGINSTIIMAKYSNYGTPYQNDDIHALFEAIKYSYYVGIAVSGFSAVLALFLKVGVIGQAAKK
ncbi:hypothetical protein C6P40_000480 [Pichia californica]|uniref:Major facilitator superfamily (MFS) profile domain-containing protein n=1 Tax=Pichia californica TaxID=460514 RepID=A0A9P6WR38_9ASCO|nr:hypothetical protein C6P42_001873 [[Candida] californica]KAG0690982.1 hypothetical protein C6P40_000480 [[Candida] californica]